MFVRIHTVLMLLVATAGAACRLAATGSTAFAAPAGAVASTVTTQLTNFTDDGRQATRFDVAGNPVDAHDGMIADGGTYYLYGTS